MTIMQASQVTARETTLVIEAIAHHRTELLLDGRLDEPMRVQMKPGFETACWSWSGDVHRVFVGDRVLERRKPDLTRDEQITYVGAYMHHERSHALYTERDAARIKRALDSMRVPFGLFNGVEDARVEHRYRSESEEGFRFNWLQYEEPPVFGTGAVEREAGIAWWAFFVLIQGEGDNALLDTLCSAFGADVRGVADEAAGFYRHAVAATDSFEAIEVAALMIKRFPGLSAMTGRCGLSVGMSMSGADGGKALEDFEQDAQDSDAGAGDAGERKDRKGSLKSNGADGFGETPEVGAKLLSPYACVELDARRVERLALRLAQLKGGVRHHREYSVSPRKRVSMRHALGGQARWISTSQSKGLQRLQKVLLVIDVSGSMDGPPQSEAAHMVAALSQCARQGLIGGDVVLSTTGSGQESRWMRKALPWSNDEASRIRTYDAEGLARTLKDNDALVEAADAVFVFTDAHIGGRKIDHAGYARRGKKVTGIYCNSEDAPLDSVREQMTEHFSRIVVRSNIEAIVDALVSGAA